MALMEANAHDCFIAPHLLFSRNNKPVRGTLRDSRRAAAMSQRVQ